MVIDAASAAAAFTAVVTDAASGFFKEKWPCLARGKKKQGREWRRLSSVVGVHGGGHRRCVGGVFKEKRCVAPARGTCGSSTCEVVTFDGG
ncbi:hypothetical protein DEO72_LG6g604 [Vigna unguiculata]|uniref:Uncharacterized protein n=1 Tax=Vigna unguiculata TaxID=3917 RepID=A0A4D6M500_VIGUN|nr:hypothetical protein DEO72_LG6g604 [Vigna unguiculata]